MNEFLKKISSYNIFNYLLPGIIFVILIQSFTNYEIIQEDIIIGVFLYYFIGLIISRFGSLIIEPFLKWIKFLKFSKYKDYIIASKNNNKIEILLEQSNMYRTFVSMFLLFFIVKIYELIGIWDKRIFLIVLLFLFLGAYKKQTNYIRNRIDKNK